MPRRTPPNATIDIGYFALELWYDGTYKKKQLAAKIAKAGATAGVRVAKGLRKPADAELRPSGVQHRHPYQLFGPEDAA